MITEWCNIRTNC